MYQCPSDDAAGRFMDLSGRPYSRTNLVECFGSTTMCKSCRWPPHHPGVPIAPWHYPPLARISHHMSESSRFGGNWGRDRRTFELDGSEAAFSWG